MKFREKLCHIESTDDAIPHHLLKSSRRKAASLNNPWHTETRAARFLNSTSITATR
ncbi:hypothetical protein [Gimesia aquarii]|uniref:hypothetical protein n=1 Tax=Gimesia aquarii TaxID=2527964 RepID=UPI0018D92E78|nr:hypothetical protein [Gimesia aquarii]